MAIYISSLNIETFRGIKNLKLNNLGDINILVGPNNCGKTSVLEAIKGISIPLEIGNWLSACRKRDNLFGTMTPYGSLDSMFNINSDDKFIKVDATISGEKQSVEIHGDDELVMMTKDEIEQMKFPHRRITNKKKQLTLDDMELEKQEEVKAISVKLLLNGGLEQNNIAASTIYDATRRVEVYSKESIRLIQSTYIAPFEHTYNIFFLKEVLEDAEMYADMIRIAKIFDSDIVNINSFSENMEQVFKITSSSNKKALPLAVYGDGIKKALLLISAVVKAKNGVLLLDELETAIHVSALKEIFTWVLEACKKFKVQLFATTHSEEAIDKLLIDAKDTSIVQNMRVITLIKEENQTMARILTGEKALRFRVDNDMELRK